MQGPDASRRKGLTPESPLSPWVRLLVRTACVAGCNRQPRTHAPALLNCFITSQQLAVRRTCKQTEKSIPFSKSFNRVDYFFLVPFCYSMRRSICRSFGSQQKSKSQVSGGISTLRSRASGLQSTTQDKQFIRTAKKTPSTQDNKPTRCRCRCMFNLHVSLRQRCMCK